MSAIRHILAVTTVCVLLPAMGLGTLAGVSARSENDGKRVGARVQLHMRGSHVSLWGGGRIGGALLNPRGDANGDLWPTIVKSSVAPHYPWVVWSRFNGANYDLAWSRWQGSTWGSIQWILPERTPGDDLDADLTFDQKGTPYVVWWRESEEGLGEVYLSMGVVYEHFHTAKSNRSPTTRRLVPEMYVEMHADDAKDLGIEDGDKVRVVTRRGSLEARAQVGTNSLVKPARNSVPRGYMFGPWNLSVADSADPKKEQVAGQRCDQP